MVTGIPPTGSTPPPSNFTPLQQLQQWAQQVYKMQPTPEGLSVNILAILNQYIEGKKPIVSLQAIVNEINQQCIQGNQKGNLDVYAANVFLPVGITPGDLQKMMALFGITPPPVTPMDQKIFDAIIFCPPKEQNGQLMIDLREELFSLGSSGSLADLKQWATQEMKSPAFADAGPETQLFFKEICDHAL